MKGILTSFHINGHSITHPQTQKLDQFRLQVSAKVIVNGV